MCMFHIMYMYTCVLVLTSIKLALMLSDPGTPEGLKCAREMLSIENENYSF